MRSPGEMLRRIARLYEGDTERPVRGYKASRLLTKDSVTSPLRTPFSRFDEETGMGEVNESIRGQGARQRARQAA